MYAAVRQSSECAVPVHAYCDMAIVPAASRNPAAPIEETPSYSKPQPATRRGDMTRTYMLEQAAMKHAAN